MIFMLMKMQTDELYCHPDVLDAGKKVVQELFWGGGGANVGEELNHLKVTTSMITDAILEECQLMLATWEEIELPAMQPYFMDLQRDST